ncbi:hypothetical protein [Collimonas antrihumi]|uniref:hypothetical protein n=1 Tax=Collimonas antrihumi TaxID=1940615 RepID=UPI001B8D3649|nr:hypothetical protein [Collimonas antrihumi]
MSDVFRADQELPALIKPQVVSGIVPQFEWYDVDKARCIGYIAYCSQAPDIEGVPGAAQFFQGTEPDALVPAMDYVDGMRLVYEQVLAGAR